MLGFHLQKIPNTDNRLLGAGRAGTRTGTSCSQASGWSCAQAECTESRAQLETEAILQSVGQATVMTIRDTSVQTQNCLLIAWNGTPEGRGQCVLQCMCACLCGHAREHMPHMCARVPHVLIQAMSVQGPIEFRRGHQTTGSWGYRQW